MNNVYRTEQERQNQKFNQKLNHLQGVVGLASWNFSFPSAGEIQRHSQKAHQLRTAQSTKHIRAIFTGFANMNLSLFSKLHRAVTQYQRDRREIHALLALDAHTLKDIGITRADVMALANKKVSAEQINAQRFGHPSAKPIIANYNHPPSEKDTKRFSVNDPDAMQKSA